MAPILLLSEQGRRKRLSPSVQPDKCSANLQSQQFGKDHGLSGIHDCAFKIGREHHEAFHARATKIRSFQLGAGHVRIFKFTGLQHGSAQIAAAEICLSKIAPN